MIDLMDACALRDVLTPNPLFDVGSGSGTPGLLLACIQPERTIILVEPLAKRTAFLKSVSYELGLRNVSVVRAKWPCPQNYEEIQVISRAVVSPENWPGLAASAGEPVQSILRMLAHKRPDMNVDGFSLGQAIDYVMLDGSERRIERWDRAV